jgi:hypothetical protein
MQIMDCRSVEFSPEKSEERIHRALQVFPRRVLMRVLAFALHVLGARRKVVAALVEMPEESVKTAVGLALRGGFPALRDRRLSVASAVARDSPTLPKVSVRREKACCVVDFGAQAKTLSMPIRHRVQVRAVLLSLLSAELLSVPETASGLGISTAHCRELARKLASQDVAEALVDKRQGQQHDYRVGPEQKAEIIQQIAARAVTGHSTSSAVLAAQVNERTQAALSARTIRWHIHNLGLANIKQTLPPLVAALKKTANDSP